MSTRFRPDRFETVIAERDVRLGLPLTYRPVTDSTNDDALAAARAGAPHGSLFVTDDQRRGRGRRGNVWWMTPGASLTFSVVLRPRVPPERSALLSLASGLAVRAAVAHLLGQRALGASLSVKWPNDVLAGGKKLAGVLVESQLQGSTLAAAVVGIGLNLGSVQLPSELQSRAISLAELEAHERAMHETGFEREVLVAEILGGLAERLRSLEARAAGESVTFPLVEELRRYDALSGLRVTVGGVTGIASGLDDRGNLLVRDALGVLHPITSGHVDILGGDGCE